VNLAGGKSVYDKKEVYTMRKILGITLAVLVSLSALSCSKQAGMKAGAGSGEAVLKLLPADTTGVVMVDMHRAMATEAAQNALKREEDKKKYDEFVSKVGIDPMKDVSFFAFGLVGVPNAEKHNGVVIVDLKYDKEALLAKLKAEAPDLKEETYNGVTLYSGGHMKSAEKDVVGAFLDASTIIGGTPEAVRQVIDVYQKKADSVLKSPEMAKVMKRANQAAVTWAAFEVPADLIAKAAEKDARVKVLEGITGLTMSFDYENKDLIADIETMGGTKENNSQIATMLNGFRAMGATFTAKEPLVSDLINMIEITSGADFVKVYVKVPGETMDKLKAMAEEKFGTMIPGMAAGKEEPKEEKKEEKK
jgi:hypothetical protein